MVEEFVFGLLFAGIVLLIVVVLICFFVRRIKARVEELPSSVYDVAFGNLETFNKKLSKSHIKKNVYQNSPLSQRPPSTLYRSHSDESITFVPCVNDSGQTGETSKENDGSTVSDSNKNIAVLKTSGETNKCLLNEPRVSLGSSNEAFASDFISVQRLPEALHALNAKRPRLNSPCPKRSEQTAFERVQLSNSRGIPTKSYSLHNPKSFTDFGNKRNTLPVNCQRSKSMEIGQQPLHSNQETAVMTDFDKIIQDLSDSEKCSEDETKSSDPVYTNVGSLALINNPEIHLLEMESETEKSCNSSTFNLQHGCDVTEQHKYDRQSGSQNDDQKEHQDYNRESVHWDYNDKSGYHDYGLDRNQEFNDQSRFQENNAENSYSNDYGYQDNSGLHENHDYNGQNEYVYQDYSGNSDYQDNSDQNEYVDFSGQKDYEDYSTQSDYQDFSGQNHYQAFSGRNDNQDYYGQNDYQDFSIQNEYQSNYYGNVNDSNEILVNEGNDECEETLANLNDGLQDHVDDAQIYDTPL